MHENGECALPTTSATTATAVRAHATVFEGLPTLSTGHTAASARDITVPVRETTVSPRNMALSARDMTAFRADMTVEICRVVVAIRSPPVPGTKPPRACWFERPRLARFATCPARRHAAPTNPEPATTRRCDRPLRARYARTPASIRKDRSAAFRKKWACVGQGLEMSRIQ